MKNFREQMRSEEKRSIEHKEALERSEERTRMLSSEVIEQSSSAQESKNKSIIGRVGRRRRGGRGAGEGRQLEQRGGKGLRA
jgi:hypothetical protein